MTYTKAPLRNDVIAKLILAAIASTNDSTKVTASIENVLDENYRSRRARSAAQNGAGVARTGDRATSVLAASKVRVAPQKRAILSVLSAAYPAALCAAEISARSGVNLNSVSTRMKELVTDLKFAREWGKVQHAGHSKLAYAATEAGRQWINGSMSIAA